MPAVSPPVPPTEPSGEDDLDAYPGSDPLGEPEEDLDLSRHHVTAVLVAHEGEQWLPEALAGLAAPDAPAAGLGRGRHRQHRRLRGAAARLVRTRPGAHPPRLDTGSGPRSRAAAGHREAVAPDRADTVAWLWLLHDDCAPEPDCLLALLRRAEAEPVRGGRRREGARLGRPPAAGRGRPDDRRCPAAGRPAWSAASSTRASTTTSTTCWRSAPPACWCGATPWRPSAASPRSSRCSGRTSTWAGG